ncbi:MAG: OstA-like protein [Bacteroidota bacterium]
MRIGLGALLCLLLSSPSGAQESKVIVLENADSLVGKILDGEDARELIGNVRVRQGNLHITSDRALQMLARGTVYLDGQVMLRDDSVTITAPRVIYHRDEREAEAFDGVRLDDGRAVLTAQYGRYQMDSGTAFFVTDVVVEDSTSTVTADSLTYLRLESRALGSGHVAVHSKTDDVTVYGGYLDHRSSGRFSRMTRMPVLVQRDTAAPGGADTLVVRSRVMESYRDSLRRFVALDSVRLVRSDLAAIAETATFFIDGDSMQLRGSPVIWYGETQVSGDSTDIYLEDRRLRHMKVKGDAFTISRGDPAHPERFDQLTADTLDLFFAEGKVIRVQADRRATSVYHIYEDSLANGVNKSSGDRILMDFEEGRASSITIFGGVEGQYIPEPLLVHSVQEFRVPGFRWRENRPTMDMIGWPWKKTEAENR